MALLLYLSEHTVATLNYQPTVLPAFKHRSQSPVLQGTPGADKEYLVTANYYVGAGWLSAGHAVYIASKLNAHLLGKVAVALDSDEFELPPAIEAPISPVDSELDLVKMLLASATLPGAEKELADLIDVQWNAPEIELQHNAVQQLSPLLIVHFLGLLRAIVRKGLKNGYYLTTQNLQSRIKGKVLVAQSLKQNVAKNRLTSNYCQYQEYGVNTLENQFLKTVLQVASLYVEAHKQLFTTNYNAIQNLFGYLSAPFQSVSTLNNTHVVKALTGNMFFREYPQAISAGQAILKRFSYSATQATLNTRTTPPYWIDMAKLFELYVYHKLLQRSDMFTNVEYHLRTYGNEVDFLAYYRRNEAEEYRPVVIDAKYKLKYQTGVYHNDMRQVAGYARLTKVYQHFKLTNVTETIHCLIIFPTLIPELEFEIQPIARYSNMYRMGICLPQLVAKNT